MHTTNPPRPEQSVVRLSQPDFTGEMHTVCNLDEAHSPQMLRQLVTGDQLAVSPSGSHVAMVNRVDASHDTVTHTGFGGERFLFDRPESSSEIATRVVSVGERVMNVWGRAEGRAPGVWLLKPRARQYLYPMSAVSGYIGTHDRIPVGQSPLYPDNVAVAMPWGLWPVRPGSEVDAIGEALFVLEQFEHGLVAYRVDARGVSSFVQTNPREVLRIVAWGSGAALVLRSPQRSAIFEIGVPMKNRPHIARVDGRAVETWSSPCKTRNVFALLVKPCEASDASNQTLYLNDRLVQEGEFSLRRQDLHWSPRGVSFAAFVRYGSYGKIVSPREEIVVPQAVSCKEALASDGGCLRAAIISDGEKDRVLMSQGRIGTRVSMAWNLHQGVDGSVVWNTVHNDMILRWVDRTHQNAVASC